MKKYNLQNLKSKYQKSNLKIKTSMQNHTQPLKTQRLDHQIKIENEEMYDYIPQILKKKINLDDSILKSSI
jgi:hypothetical protein